MGEKLYNSPIFFGQTVGDDPHIVLPPSQTTSGYDTPYTFQGFGDEYEAELTMLKANADDFQLKAMDVNNDFVITYTEYINWWNNQDPKPWD